MKQKTLREDAHSREAETCRKRPRETPECAKAHSFLPYHRQKTVRNRSAGLVESKVKIRYTYKGNV